MWRHGSPAEGAWGAEAVEPDTPVAPVSPAERLGQEALHALERGSDAARSGDLAEARRWLDRAHRLAPDDVAARLALATVLLRLGAPDEAEPHFTRAATAADTREAWLGLAASRLALGRATGAAEAASRLLTRHALPPDGAIDTLLTRIAIAVGAPGWCGIGSDGTLRLTPSTACVSLDGRPIPNGCLLDDGAFLEARVAGRPLLGSKLPLATIRRVEGLVEADAAGNVTGWAWHPGMPETKPTLVIHDAATGRELGQIVAERLDPTPLPGLAQRRRFEVPSSLLSARKDPTGGVIVTDRDRRPLSGSPVTPVLPPPPSWPRAAISRRSRPPAPERPVAIVVPAYRGHATTLACLRAVTATAPTARVVVVDDASPEPALAAALARMARSGRITLIRHERNRGFPGAVNAGMRAVLQGGSPCDLVLLNSDTIVAPGWIARLQHAIRSDARIGTATPFSNDASILSYPGPNQANPVPSAAALRRLARLADKGDAGAAPVDIPTGVGFCLYIRHECLDEVGPFREDAFAQGYGEENDFCRRAAAAGWRNVAVPGAYVAHVGGQSFGAARPALMARNLDVLERLHPGYRATVADFIARDPLAPARRRLDALRWAAARRRTGATILVTHDSGGGVERAVRERVAAIRAAGRRAIVLRPVRNDRRTSDACVLSDGAEGDTPNLYFALPDELPDLARLLRDDRPDAVEIHNLLGHHPSVLELAARLDVPHDIHVHDHAWFCPRISLLGAFGGYCGEPVAARDCDSCVARAGRNIEEEIDTAGLRARSARLLGSARRVVAPSDDAGRRLRRHFSAIRPDIVPHEPAIAAPPRTRAERNRVCVVGAIGPEKGFSVLLDCARDAASRDLSLDFVLVGHSADDAALHATGRVFVTGRYREDEATALIGRQGAAFGLLPSVVPETWCYALGEAWRAGLDVAVFDIGAQAQRVRARGRGLVLPLGLPPPTINDTVLAALKIPRNE